MDIPKGSERDTLFGKLDLCMPDIVDYHILNSQQYCFILSLRPFVGTLKERAV